MRLCHRSAGIGIGNLGWVATATKGSVVMRRIFWIAAVCLILPASAALATSTFDTDGESWIYQNMYFQTGPYAGGGYDAVTSPATITDLTPFGTYSATGGHDGGYIYLSSDGTQMPRPYHMGRYGGAWLGDLTGTTLAAEFMRLGDDWRTVNGSTGAAAPTLRWVITDAAISGNAWEATWYVSKAAASIDVNSLTDAWTSYDIAMLEENFFLWPNATGTMAFADMLSGYNMVGVSLYYGLDTGFGWVYPNHLPSYGAYSAGTESILGMDNFGVVVPEPMTMALFGSGLAVLAARRRRAGVR